MCVMKTFYTNCHDFFSHCRSEWVGISYFKKKTPFYFRVFLLPVTGKGVIFFFGGHLVLTAPVFLF